MESAGGIPIEQRAAADFPAVPFVKAVIEYRLPQVMGQAVHLCESSDLPRIQAGIEKERFGQRGPIEGVAAVAAPFAALDPSFPLRFFSPDGETAVEFFGHSMSLGQKESAAVTDHQGELCGEKRCFF